MSKRVMILGICLLCGLLASNAYGDKLRVPEEYQTIQSAIATVEDGDTILVSPGTYVGAIIDKTITLRARGRVIINDGPNSHSFLRAGFLFNKDYTGSGTRIIGFRFMGEPQDSYEDDGKLDFPIFSRGADHVTVKRNIMLNSLQAITNWNGSGWKVHNNIILDLWTLNGGGIGVLVGGSDGGSHRGNSISKNKVLGTLKICSCDSGGYDGTGIVLYADFRSKDGAEALTGNRIYKNKISLISDTPDVVNANGIELTDTRDNPSPPVIFSNRIQENEIDGVSRSGISVTGTPDNVFAENDIEDSADVDVFDNTTGRGSAGTANIWADNDCSTSSPTGLCDDDDDRDDGDDSKDDDDD